MPSANNQFGPPLQDGSNSMPANSFGPQQHGAQMANPSQVNADSSSSHQGLTPQQQASLRQRQRAFLGSLASIHQSKGTPLPPALTGVPYPPNHDPSNSPWKSLDCSSGEPGILRISGRDIDLLKLWSIVTSAGGGPKIASQNLWPLVLQKLDMQWCSSMAPENLKVVATNVANHYSVILHPFEEVWRRNVQAQEQNRKAQMARQQSDQQGSLPANTGSASNQQSSASSHVSNQMHVDNGGASDAAGHASTSTSSPQVNNLQLPRSPISQKASSVPATQSPAPNGFSDGDDAQSRKRAHEGEEMDGKRARQKTGLLDLPDTLPSLTTSPLLSSGGPVPSPQKTPSSSQAQTQYLRTKVEYVPYAREVETYGGRDLNAMDEDYARSTMRPIRDINEWGTVDIEALTMSIRSRLTAELSYALTTLMLLSTMRGPTPGSGFPIAQCPDLMDDVLDLMEDEAFGGTPDLATYNIDARNYIPRHKELVQTVVEDETCPFAGLESREGSQRGRKLSSAQHSPANLILAVLNVIRNLSVIPDNQPYLAQHERLLDLVLRMGGIVQDADGQLRAVSSALSLPDVISVRKEAISILGNLAGMIQYPSTAPSPAVIRSSTRAFELLASVLVEPSDAVPPMQLLKDSNLTLPTSRPPQLADLALDIFTRLAQPDQNRKVLATVIPETWIWKLLESLVRRLPMSDHDFAFLSREPWLCYTERAVMSIYALAFLSSAELKRKIRTDRKLCFPQVMIRVVQKLLMTPPHLETRQWYLVTARRAVEALKLIDVGQDSFDAVPAVTPALAFGMGFGESGDSGVERGTGLFGGRRDVWDLLMQRDLDPIMFTELESLTRVEF
ncbi:hypothetical protein CONPUDRAFT_95221 [Coniophora puteana RWD-64-598 SS2]|uniref:ARID domain-containing protein n=1 Tax=Coniophora puteana (strain RWD-64-598) TaxID=741705 RepID=A0A5M3N590_CONPW|nr:uncharacterized protein CONPUDRAFT_95221 [Coniophora puteana RWD-64-598 SS2]EIW86580.1 hypothetical protein CONPUDRAFT_95221 [Coniophora puteana RWD-64-598 SS2]